MSLFGRGGASKIYYIACNALREAVRMKLFLGLVILAMLIFASSFLFTEFNLGQSELKFIADFGFGGITLFGSALSIVITAQLFFGDIEHRTALTLLAKPVRRMEFVVGKFLGAWATVLIFIFVLTVCIVVALWLREGALLLERPDLFPEGRIVDYAGIFIYSFFQALRLAMICALVVLFASYASSSLFCMIMGAFVWIAGQLQHVATEAWETLDNFALKIVFATFSLIVPNFHLFDFGDLVTSGEFISIGTYGQLLAYSIVYMLFYLALAVVAFEKREI